jgi:hypothetical protein
MKTQTPSRATHQWSNYQQLELIENPSAVNRNAPSWYAQLQHFGQKLLARLVARPELRVWQTSDRQGHPHWHAYNPFTRRSVHSLDEAEMRLWIEQQYGYPKL